MPSTTLDTALKARRIACEPLWQPQVRYTNRVLPPATRAWLTDDGSLTTRLISLGAALGKGEFAVQRLSQGWQVPLPSERRLLETPPRQLALVREVALWLGLDKVVFARSLFPLESLSGSLAHLRRLQNKSLGAILFSHPSMRRLPFELALIPGDSPYLPADLRQNSAAWGRRSRFEIEGKRLLVSEVFLQAFKPWPTAVPVHRSQRGRVSAAIMPPTQ